MIKEYCDKCGAELVSLPDVKDAESETMIEQSNKFTVKVLEYWMKDVWDVSTDVLCRKCAVNFSIGDPTT